MLLASSLGALLSRFHYRIVLPTVVLEIVLGIVIGPDGLGVAEVDSYLAFLANAGLAFLFFFAGVEVVEKHVPRRSLARGTAGWAISIALGLTLGAVLERVGSAPNGGSSASRSPRPRSARSSPSSATPASSARRSARPCSGPASPASSGRSSSSRSS